MTIVIDPTFSAFDLIGRLKSQVMLRHRRTMSLVSFEIENATIEHKAHARIFAGFQYMSKFLPQVERYRKLAANSESVYVFGVPDTRPPEIPNVTYIDLKPSDRLAREWFLISSAPEYYAALATEELTEIDDPDETRVFEGIWTYDLPIISIMHDWLSSAVDVPPLTISDEERDFRRQAQLMSNTVMSLMSKVPLDAPSNPVLAGEVRTAITRDLNPAINTLVAESPEDDEQDVVVMFTDVRDFTSLTEQFGAREVVARIINPYVKIVSAAVDRHGGNIDKYLGDGVLAVFGLETTANDDADRAMTAAAEIIHQMAEMASNDLKPAIGIGLAAGTVAVTTIGSEVHSERTVIGDAVNLAERLSQLSYNDVWLSDNVHSRLSDRAGIESKGMVMLKGKAHSQPAFRRAVTSGY